MHSILVEIRLDGKLDNQFDEAGKRCCRRRNHGIMKIPTSTDGDVATNNASDNAQPDSGTDLRSAVSAALGSNTVITDRKTHLSIVEALMDHLWNIKGSSG